MGSEAYERKVRCGGRRLNGDTGRPLASRADNAERALIGALLNGSKKKSAIFEALGNGDCLRSQRLRSIYSVCKQMQLEGREPDGASVADWFENRGRLGEIGGLSFLAELEENSAIDALVGQHCDEVQKAYRGRQAQEALLAASQKLAAGEDSDRIAAMLSDRLSELSKSDQTHVLKVLPISELLSEEVPDVKWMVDGIIPSNGFCMIAGDSGVGKTWLLLDLALSVASGRPWLGTLPTTKGPVLFIDEESGVALLKNRLLKLGQKEDLRDLPICFSTLEGLKVDTEQGRAKLRGTIKKYGAKLVVIDSFVRIHGGDENSVVDISKVTEALSRIAREEDCAIVVAHHARKKGPSLNEPGDRLRGTSEIKAALDVHLFVSREKGGAIKIRHDKARFGKTVDPVLVRLNENGHGQLRLEAVKEAVAKVEEGKRAIMERVTGAELHVLKSELVRVCKEKNISARTAGTALARLEEEGRIRATKVVEHDERGRAKTLRAYIAKASSSNDSRPHGADFERGD
jgi:replicative DNA helicase